MKTNAYFFLGIKIIALLEPKLINLMNNATAPLDAENTDAAYKYFQQLTSETCAAIQYESYKTDDCIFIQTFNSYLVV